MRTYPVGRHDNLDVLRRLEPVQLVQQLQHRPLHLRVAAAGPALPARAPDGVDLVHEDDARRVLARHDEQLADHPAALADVLLHELGAGHADEPAVGVVRDGTREERLSGTRGAIEENTLWLGDTERLEELGVLDGKFDDLLDFLNLLVETADHLVCAVWDFLNHHEGDERVDFVGEDLVYGV